MKTNKKLIGLFIFTLALVAVFLSSCMHEHSFNSWTTSNEATCITAGTEIRSCSSCKYTETRSISAKGHYTIKIPAVSPTCTKAGNTEGSKCSRCGVVLTATKTIPAQGHNMAKIPAVSPTCTKAGNTEGSKCSRCGVILTEAKTIPAKGHNEDANGTCKTCGTNTMLQDIKEKLEVKLIVIKPRSDKNSYVQLYINNQTKYTVTISEGTYDILHSARVNGEVLIPWDGNTKLEPGYYIVKHYLSYRGSFPAPDDYFYCDNDSIGFVKFSIGEKRVFIKFDVNGLLDAGFTAASIGWY